MICSIAFYYRPFNLLSPPVTEDKSKTVRYFKLWSALHLKLNCSSESLDSDLQLLLFLDMSQNSALLEGFCLIQKQDKALFKAKEPYKALVPVNNPKSNVLPFPELGTFSQAQQILVLPVQLSNPFSSDNKVFSDLFLGPIPSSLLHLLSSLFPEGIFYILPEKGTFPFPFCSHVHHLAEVSPC